MGAATERGRGDRPATSSAREPARLSAARACLLLAGGLLAIGCRAAEPADLLRDPDLGLRASSAAADYEPGRRVASSSLLEPGLLQSSLHRVEPTARVDGLQARFRVRTPYATYEVLGSARVPSLLAEVRAIHALRAQSEEGFGLGLIESVPASFKAIRELLQHPRAALAVWPSALREFVVELGPTFKGWRGQREDSIVAAFLSVSKFKRRLAERLRVDVYSDNPLLQYELNRLGWEAAVGNWTPTLLKAPLEVPLGLSVLTTALSWSTSFETYLREHNPAQVRVQCDARLARMGASPALRERLQRNARLTPRHVARLTQLLEELPHARARAAAVEWLAESRLALGAFYKLRALALLPSGERDPVVELARGGELLLARRQSGEWLLPLPADLVSWTPWLERHLEAGRPLRLLVEGALSPRARAALSAAGVKVEEGVEPLR